MQEVGTAARGGGGSIRKEHDDGDKDAFHQKTVLQEKITTMKAEHRATTQKLAKCRQQLDRYEAGLKGLQEQFASIRQEITEQLEAITERVLLEACGELPTAKAKLVSLTAKDLTAFNIDEDELPVQAPEAQEALAAFKASPHFARTQQALCKQAVQLVEFAKEDVEALWAVLSQQAQPASEWTKEQLQTAIESVQRTGAINSTVAHGPEMVAGWAQRAVVELPNWPRINIYNLYLHAAGGMSARNANIIMAIGLAIAGQIHPCIVGGDWNMEAQEHESVTETELQAIADGWKWRQDSLQGLVAAHEGGRNAARHQVFQDEVQGFLGMDYIGQNLSARLDASAQQGRRLLQHSRCKGDLTSLVEDFDEDINFAMQQANKDSNGRWKEWCDGACAGGAGKFHRPNKVRKVQAPTTANDAEHGITGHPHYVVKNMEDKHAKLWRAATEAPQAWIPDRSTLQRRAPAELRHAAGHRLVMMHSMARRVWQRQRKPALRQLQKSLWRPYWEAAKNRSAIDSAWILAADAEQNAERGDGHADVVIEARALEQYDLYVTLHPLVRFSSHIDDTSPGLNSAAKEGVIEQAVQAGQGFLSTARHIGARLNEELAVVASSADIARPAATYGAEINGLSDTALHRTPYFIAYSNVLDLKFCRPEKTLRPLLTYWSNFGGMGMILGLDSCAAPESMARSYLRKDDGGMEAASDGSCTKPSARKFQRAGPRRLHGGHQAGNKGKEQQLVSKTSYACVARFAQSLEGSQRVQQCHRVKAHRSGTDYEAMGYEQRRLTDDNKVVDVRAKTATSMHPRPDDAMAEAMETAVSRIGKVARLVANVIPIFDKGGQLTWTRRTQHIGARLARHELVAVNQCGTRLGDSIGSAKTVFICVRTDTVTSCTYTKADILKDGDVVQEDHRTFEHRMAALHQQDQYASMFAKVEAPSSERCWRRQCRNLCADEKPVNDQEKHFEQCQ
ncbi:unnamed protein product [Prorocentrum cordatum]|uniref:Uncharacterized protein n=1 Tax=Prorocentrum cordatum TaxID=2364126 RepID=A0ABN9TKM7_9DINO|nr:unnamed protein product [Polarella glacialis]